MKHLRYFAALSRHRHFGRAAQACAISQPALSVQMKELEAILGAPLIERSARQIRLTRLGEALAMDVGLAAGLKKKPNNAKNAAPPAMNTPQVRRDCRSIFEAVWRGIM